MEKPNQPRRTQTERSRESREKILLAATEFFSRHGFNNAVMKEIAEAANLTLPGLLHHFPNKNTLLMAVLAERDKANRGRFMADQDRGKTDPIEPFARLVEYNETVPGMVQLFTVLVAESLQEQHPAHPFFIERYQTARAEYLDLLKKAQQRGEVRDDIPAGDLFTMVFAMMDGLQIQWLLQPEKVNMAKVFRQFVALLRKPSR